MRRIRIIMGDVLWVFGFKEAMFGVRIMLRS